MTNILGKRRVGSTDLFVPELGFGTVALGLLTNEDAHIGQDAVRNALSRGLNLIDVAPYYGNGRAELRLGEALADFPRDSYQIATKVGRMVFEEDETRENAWQPPYDYSYDGVMRCFETSLRRLRTDRIEILLIHDIGMVMHGDNHPETFRTAMEGGYRAVTELKDSGVVSAIGIGANEWQVFEQAMGVHDFDVFLLAGRYTLLEQESLSSFLPMCVKRGSSVLVGGPFNSGILAKGPHPGVWYNYAAAPEDILERVRRTQDICESYGVKLPTAALRFPGAHPAVASVLFGPRGADEVDANLDEFFKPIPTGVWEDLKSAGLLRTDAPTPA